MVDLTELPLSKHTWRLKYVMGCVRWVKAGKGHFKKQGHYKNRIVFQVRAGLLNEWTAYAHYNDDLKLTNETE